MIRKINLKRMRERLSFSSILPIGVLFIFLFLLFSCNRRKEIPASVETEQNDSIDAIIEIDTIPRTSISFILGKDNSEFNQYYGLANYYYRLNPEDKTEIVIDSLISILEVSNYLANNPPKNGRPYGLINLVSHGNEFVDLKALVYPKGPRTSTESLEKAIQDSVFIPLDTTIIDKKSLIYMHGCAIGNNQKLLTNIGIALGSKTNGVKVKASKLFEYYTYLSKNKNPKSIRRYFAKNWYAFYHPDSIPGHEEFARRFSERYPSDSVNWLEGAKRRFQSNPAELYHFSFVVPAQWEELYTEESHVPKVNTRLRRQEWLMNNQPFLDLLDKTQVPLEYFQFKYYKPKYTQKSDTVYALQVRGKAGVVCLIQPLLAENDSLKARFEPLNPAEDDPFFFEFSESDE